MMLLPVTLDGWVEASLFERPAQLIGVGHGLLQEGLQICSTSGG